jgi:hypothetical protein
VPSTTAIGAAVTVAASPSLSRMPSGRASVDSDRPSTVTTGRVAELDQVALVGGADVVAAVPRLDGHEARQHPRERRLREPCTWPP